ncbi:MAG: helix-turn-helix domain-containing protein [Nitrososphaerales archaeon]
MNLDIGTIEGKLSEILDLSLMEAKVYLTLLKREEGLTLEELKSLLENEDIYSLIKALEGKGLIIKGGGDRYLALHPRMALTNAWKIYQDKVLKELLKRRREVDKLVLMIQRFQEL